MKGPKDVPQVPGNLPLIGHSLPLLHDPLKFLVSLPAHGDLVKIRLGPLETVVVCDPELTQTVLRHDRIFDKGGPLYDQLREIFGDGLATCPHSRHRRQRRLTQPAFRTTRLPAYAQIMTAQAHKMTASWRENDILDVPAATLTLTMRVVVETMFSGSLPAHVLQQAIDDCCTLLRESYRRMITPSSLSRLQRRGNHRFHQARTRLRKTVSEVIADRRISGADHGDLLSALLTAHELTSEGEDHNLTDAEVSDQVISFFLAGSETTASALAWVFYLLGQHPDVAERVRAEVDAVLGGEDASFDHLPDLKLTGQVITETLRLYPPVWLLTRAVTTDTRLGTYDLPAGTTLIYSPYLIHHRGDLYQDPERFDPDRWDHTLQSPPPRHAFIPFGGGARKCIGDTLSTAEATLALATITAGWDLRPLPGQRVRPARAITLRPNKLHMRATARATTQSSRSASV